jgi:hypothetical protein
MCGLGRIEQPQVSCSVSVYQDAASGLIQECARGHREVNPSALLEQSEVDRFGHRLIASIVRVEMIFRR